MAQDESQNVLLELKPGDHRIYRSLDQGVVFLGLPFWWLMYLLFGGALGYFVIKSIFSFGVALVWLVLLGLAWAAIGFVQNQDKTFIPMMVLKYIVGAKFYSQITSYTRSRQRVALLDS